MMTNKVPDFLDMNRVFDSIDKNWKLENEKRKGSLYHYLRSLPLSYFHQNVLDDYLLLGVYYKHTKHQIGHNLYVNTIQEFLLLGEFQPEDLMFIKQQKISLNLCRKN